MKWKHRLAVLAFHFLPIFALLLCSAIYLVRLANYLSVRTAPIVAQLAAESLNRQVRIGSVSALDRLGYIVLDNVRISNGPTFASDGSTPATTAKSIAVNYDFPYLLSHPEDSIESVNTIEVDTANLYLERLKPGKYNFSDLLTKKNQKPSPLFLGIVILLNATVEVKDDAAPEALLRRTQKYSKVKATVDFSSASAISFSVNGDGSSQVVKSLAIRGQSLRAAPLSAHKSPAPIRQGYGLDITFIGANVTRFAPYLLDRPRAACRLLSGTAAGEVTMKQVGNVHAPLRVAGTVSVTEGSLRLFGKSLLAEPVTGIAGTASFTQRDAAFSGAASLDRQAFDLSGTVVNFKSPQVYVEADTNGVNYAAIRSAVPSLPAVPAIVHIASRIALHAWIAGPLSNPTVDASLGTPSIDVDRYKFTNVAAVVTYGARRLAIRSLTFNSPYGAAAVSASGFVDNSTSPPMYHLAGEARAFNFSKLPLPANVIHSLEPLDASVSAVFDAAQNGLTAKLASDGGMIHGVRFDAAEADVSWQFGKAVTLRKFFIREPHSGILIASGTVSPPPSSAGMELKFRAVQIDLSQFEPLFGKTSIGGLAYTTGTLTGPLLSPTIASHLFILQPAFGQFAANELSADFSGDFNKLRIERLLIRHIPGSANGSGTISGLSSGRPDIDAAFTLHSVPVSYLAAANRTADASFPLTGFVSGSGTVNGLLGNPLVAASLALDNGAFQDLQLTNAIAKVHYQQGIVGIDEVEASVAGVDIIGSGSFNLAENSISLDLNASANDLGQVTQRYVPSLQIFGGLQVAVTVAGNAKRPDVVATVSTKDVSVEGTKLAVTPATFSYRDNSLSMTQGPLVVSAGPAEYVLNGFGLNLTTKQIESAGYVHGETVAHLLSIVQKSPYLTKVAGRPLNAFLAKTPQPPTGAVELNSVEVSGSLQHPLVAVNADLTAASIGGQAIDRLHTEFSVQATKTTLTALHLTGPDNVYMDASGSLDTGGAVNMDFEASGFNLSLLNPYLPKKGEASGTLSDLTAVVSGSTRTPAITASITLDKPAYNSITLDSIDSGEIDIRNDHLTVSGLTFTKEEKSAAGTVIDHTLDVSGSLPFDWKTGEFLQAEIPTNVPISLTATLPDQSLEFVNQIFPDIPVKVPSGKIGAVLKITGTLNDKQLNGNVVLSDAAVMIDGYQTQLNHIEAEIVLAGNTLSVPSMTAASNYGGAVSISGSGQFTGGSLMDSNPSMSAILSDLKLAFQVKANNLTINERKIALFNNAGATVRINNGVSIEGSVLRPKIHGEVDIDHVLAALPQSGPGPTSNNTVPEFNPLFDITFDIKPEAQIKTSQLDAFTDGSVVLTGSLFRPDIDGHFLIRKGQFVFPTAIFKVVPTGLLDITYHPPDVLRENLDLTADTAISVSPEIIARNPAGANTTTPYVPTVSTAATASSASQRYEITVTVSGDVTSPDKLNLSFSSDPPGLTDAQILAVLGGQEAIAGLTGGNMQRALQNQVAAVFSSSVVPMVLQPFEDSIGTVLGLDQFSIDYVPESPVQVTFVKRLSGRLSLTYTQSVNSRSPGAVSSTLEPPVYQVKLGYSFTPRIEATLSTDDQGNNIAAIEGVHNF